MARIFNDGIDERVATFETRPQSAADAVELIATSPLVLVAERDGRVVAWAKVARYDDPHDYYAGVGEATVYVERAARRSGVARELLETLAPEAKRSGFHKLVGKVFTSNEPSIALVRRCGWREVGIHLRHGRLEREWKDVLVVERLLDAEEADVTD